MTNEQLRMQMLAGVITEGEYKAKLQENKKKKSLKESMIGGIVGIGAINQIPPRAKADYEMAFEHFLGERYDYSKFENREQDPHTMNEEEMPAVDSRIKNDDENDEEIPKYTGPKNPMDNQVTEDEIEKEVNEENKNELILDGLYMELKDVLFPYYTDLRGEERVSMIDDVITELNSYIGILQREKKAKQ